MSWRPVSLRLSCRLCAAGRGLAEYSGSSLLPSATSIISSDNGYGTFISEEPSRWNQRGGSWPRSAPGQMCTLNQVVVSPLPPLTSSYPAWTDVSHHEGDTRPRRSRNRMNGMSHSCRTPCTTRGNRNCT
jgi:hypothetical protein